MKSELNITIIRILKTQTARGNKDDDRLEEIRTDSTKRDAEENLVWCTRNEKKRKKQAHGKS